MYRCPSKRAHPPKPDVLFYWGNDTLCRNHSDLFLEILEELVE